MRIEKLLGLRHLVLSSAPRLPFVVSPHRPITMSSSSPEKVHFFDIKSKLPGDHQTWSPNTIKVRMTLNYKQIPYTQSYISYPDIAPLLASLGVPEWTPKEYPLAHTLPAIMHSSISKSTGPKASDAHVLMDSIAIAKHLDAIFPERPVFPKVDIPGFENAMHVVTLGAANALRQAWITGYDIVIPTIADILDDRGEEYFDRTRTEPKKGPPRQWGSKNPEDDWKPFEKSLAQLAKFLKGSDEHPNPGPFFLGTQPCYSDFTVAAFLAWFKAGNEQFFDRILKVGDGEYRRLWEASEKWVYGQGEDKEWKIEGVKSNL